MRTLGTNGIVKHVRDSPELLTLYSSAGVELTPSTGLSDQKIYEIDIAASEGGSAEFCVGMGTKDAFKLGKVAFKVSAAVGIVIIGKYKIGSSWIIGGYAWDPTRDNNLTFVSTDTQKWNAIFPYEVICGTPLMVSIAIDGPGTVQCQMIEV